MQRARKLAFRVDEAVKAIRAKVRIQEGPVLYRSELEVFDFLEREDLRGESHFSEGVENIATAEPGREDEAVVEVLVDCVSSVSVLFPPVVTDQVGKPSRSGNLTNGCEIKGGRAGEIPERAEQTEQVLFGSASFGLRESFNALQLESGGADDRSQLRKVQGIESSWVADALMHAGRGPGLAPETSGEDVRTSIEKEKKSGDAVDFRVVWLQMVVVVVDLVGGGGGVDGDFEVPPELSACVVVSSYP